MLIILLILFLPIKNLLANNSDITDDICAVAEVAIPGFLEKIPLNYESRYGFRNRDDFKIVKPGSPLRLYSINLDTIDNTVSRDPVPTNEWRVPLMVNGICCSFLTVSLVDTTLKAVGIGGAPLAKELNEVNKSFPSCKKVLLRVDQLRCDFVIISCKSGETDSDQYYPLKSAMQLLGTDKPLLYSRSALFTQLYRSFQQQSTDR
jgi:hypothetical protein